MEFEGNGISQTEAIALTDRLRNELFRLGVFEVVERGMMETILTEQDFQLTGCTSNECLVEVGQLLGARQMVGGRISRVGAMFTVSARVVDVETGKLLGVSDFDLRGGLEEMLTRGMHEVAVSLAGIQTVPYSIQVDSDEPELQPEPGPAKSVTIKHENYALSEILSPIEIDPKLFRTTYKYNGKFIDTRSLWKIVLSSNDNEIKHLRNKYILLGIVSMPLCVIGPGLCNESPIAGVFLYSTGLWLVRRVEKKQYAAVERYNQIVAKQ